MSTDPFHQSDCRVAAPRCLSEPRFHEHRSPRGHSLHDPLLETSSAPNSTHVPVVHHTFDQAQQRSFIVGSHQDLLNPKILMNAVRNELAQSDAPFLSTTVAAKHPVEQFRHLTHMTLCNLQWTSQLSSKSSVLTLSCTHLLLQCSQRVLHTGFSTRQQPSSRVGSHARAKGFERVKERTQRDFT